MAQPETAKDGLSTNSRRGRKRPATKSLQQMTSVSDMNDCAYTGKCDPNATEWAYLPLFAVFSLTPDGAFPKVKDSQSSYIDLRTKDHPTGLATGRCYRVYL